MREWIYGRNPVFEALRANRRHIFRLIVSQSVQDKSRLTEISNICVDRKIPVERVARKRLDRFGSEHQGIALEVDPYPYCDVQDILINASDQKEPAFILILDTLQDPQNLGAIIRTAEGAGVDGIILPERRAAGLTDTVYSISAGALEYLKVTQVTNLARTMDELRKKGIWMVGAESSSPKPWYKFDYTGPVGLVLGSEGKGLRPLVKKKCDEILSLPLPGNISSLNVSAAAAIFIYEVVRQRQQSS